MSDQPKIQIDSDWKSQAQREKERLAEQERKSKAASAAPSPAGAGVGAAGAAGAVGAGRPGSWEQGELPPANWETLVAMMATQAIMYLGGAMDQRTGQPIVDLDVARHQIDLLSVMQEKTKGNLTDEESRQLSLILHDLRMRYIQIAQASNPLVAEAMGSGEQAR